MTRQLWIRLAGDLDDATGEALGCLVVRENGVWLRTEYTDQSHLTGLLIRLGDLHLGFESVVVGDEAHPGPTSNG